MPRKKMGGLVGAARGGLRKKASGGPKKSSPRGRIASARASGNSGAAAKGIRALRKKTGGSKTRTKLGSAGLAAHRKATGQKR